MNPYQCGSCRRTFSDKATYCPLCNIPFSETVEGDYLPEPPRPLTKEEKGALAVVTFVAPAGLCVTLLCWVDQLSAWPITLGVTISLALGLTGSLLINRDDKSAPVLEELWNVLRLLTTIVPAELCILTLYSVDLLSTWTVIGGLATGLALGRTLSYLLIGDEERPGWLRRVK
jgi:hypothetical protein